MPAMENSSQFLTGYGELERSPPTWGRMRIPVLCLHGGEHSAITRCFMHSMSRVSKNKDAIQQPLAWPALSGPGGWESLDHSIKREAKYGILLCDMANSNLALDVWWR